MQFSCKKCNTQYTIADEKVRGKVIKVRCKRCNHLIVVRSTSPTLDPKGSARAGEGILQDSSLESEFDKAFQGIYESKGKKEPTSRTQVDSIGPLPEPEWFYGLDGSEEGPYTLGEMEAKIRTGSVTDQHFIWRDGMSDWLPMGEIPELAMFLTYPGPVRSRRQTVVEPKKQKADAERDRALKQEKEIRQWKLHRRRKETEEFKQREQERKQQGEVERKRLVEEERSRVMKEEPKQTDEQLRRRRYEEEIKDWEKERQAEKDKRLRQKALERKLREEAEQKKEKKKEEERRRLQELEQEKKTEERRRLEKEEAREREQERQRLAKEEENKREAEKKKREEEEQARERAAEHKSKEEALLKKEQERKEKEKEREAKEQERKEKEKEREAQEQERKEKEKEREAQEQERKEKKREAKEQERKEKEKEREAKEQERKEKKREAQEQERKEKEKKREAQEQEHREKETESRRNAVASVLKKREKVREDRHADRIAEHFFDAEQEENDLLPPPVVDTTDELPEDLADTVQEEFEEMQADPMAIVMRRDQDGQSQLSKTTKMIVAQAGVASKGRRFSVGLLSVIGVLAVLSAAGYLAFTQGWFGGGGSGRLVDSVEGASQSSGPKGPGQSVDIENLSPEDAKKYRDTLWKVKQKNRPKGVGTGARRPGRSNSAPVLSSESKELLDFYQNQSEEKREFLPRTPSSLAAAGQQSINLPSGSCDMPDLSKTESKHEVAPVAPTGLSSQRLTDLQVRRVIQKHYHKVKNCLERQLKRDSSVSGKMYVVAKVRPNGRVQTARIATKKFHGTFVEECLIKEVKRWDFPTFKGEAYELRFPLLLSARGE